MSGSLDRDALLDLLDDLSRRLERARVRAHIYVIGGAAMTLSFRRDRTTHDMDARIEKTRQRARDIGGDTRRGVAGNNHQRRLPANGVQSRCTACPGGDAAIHRPRQACAINTIHSESCQFRVPA